MKILSQSDEHSMLALMAGIGREFRRTQIRQWALTCPWQEIGERPERVNSPLLRNLRLHWLSSVFGANSVAKPVTKKKPGTETGVTLTGLVQGGKTRGI